MSEQGAYFLTTTPAALVVASQSQTKSLASMLSFAFIKLLPVMSVNNKYDQTFFLSETLL